MNTLTKRQTDQPPVITPPMRRQAYARLFAIALADPSEHKRQAALNAIRLYVQLRERCPEQQSA
jgi:hypothetical protein